MQLRPPQLPRGRYTPVIPLLILGALVLCPVLIYVVSGLLPAQPKARERQEPRATRIGGKSPLEGWSASHKGKALPVDEPPPNGAPPPVSVPEPPPVDQSKDILLQELQAANKDLLAKLARERAERERLEREHAKAKPDKDAEERKAAAKKRAEELRKEAEDARKTLVFWTAGAKDGASATKAGFTPPSGSYVLLSGVAKMNCVLETALNSDIPADIIVKVTEPVYDSVYGDPVLIPPGSTLRGAQRGTPIFGEARVPVVFSELKYPNGGTIKFGKDVQGLDGEGRGGLTGDVDNHWGRLLASVVITSVLEGGMYGVSGAYGGDTVDAIGAAAARNAANEGRARTKRFLNSNPTINVPQREPCVLIVDQDYPFPPVAVEAMH